MLSLLSLAAAAEVADGLQMHLYEGGLDAARALVEGQTFTLAYDDLGAEYDCWDYVGVSDLSLDIPIEKVTSELDDDVVHLSVTFGRVYAEDFQIYSLDDNSRWHRSRIWIRVRGADRPQGDHGADAVGS